MRTNIFCVSGMVLFVLASGCHEDIAPSQSIISVNGTVSEGSSLTISGSSFGTKNPAVPFSFLDFEDGDVGTDIDSTGTQANSDGWITSADAEVGKPEYDNTRSYGQGNQSMLCNPTGASGDMKSKIYYTWSPVPEGQKWYFSYDAYLTGDVSSSGTKLYRLLDCKRIKFLNWFLAGHLIMQALEHMMPLDKV